MIASTHLISGSDSSSWTTLYPSAVSTYPDGGWCVSSGGRSLRRMTSGKSSPASASSFPRRVASEESGQIMLMTGLLLTIMLVVVALVIDIGHAQLVQRQLQAGVDAAALAGAQELPVTADATATAHEYSPTPGRKNAVNTINNATTTVEARCITSIPGCNTRYATSNAISVSASAKVPTFFARLIGVNDLTVRANSTACYPCTVVPLDIMIVLDRTGSMCDKTGDDRPSNKCVDLNAARQGVKTFLALMDPKLDRVGLAVSPPAVGPSVHSDVTTNVPPCLAWSKFPHIDANCTTWTKKTVQVRNPDSPQNVCAMPDQNDNYFGYDAYAPWWLAETDSSYRENDRAFYVVSSLSDDDVDGDASDDFVVEDANGNWDLNPSSPIISTLDCVHANGSTSYSMAIEEAQHELTTHGRPGVQDVIVFFTDGGANITQKVGGNPTWWSGITPWKSRPCGSGVEAARRLPSDTAVYTIGYDLKEKPGDPPLTAQNRCNTPDSNGHSNFNNAAETCPQTWGCGPTAAMKAMATSPPGSNDANFFAAATPETLPLIFARLAGAVLSNSARLVDDDLPDLTE